VRRGTQRDGAWAGAEAEALHHDRYQVAEGLYVAEVDPVARADLVIDNTDFAEPLLVHERGAPEP
jgi:uridine kinase